MITRDLSMDVLSLRLAQDQEAKGRALQHSRTTYEEEDKII